MVPLVYFVDENNLHYISLNAKVHDFINHDTKEWNIHSISSIPSQNVLADIKAISIPWNCVEDRILWGCSKDGKFILKSAT